MSNRWILTTLFAVMSMYINVHAAVFLANYTDGAGEGFNDPTHGASRQTAFEYALGLWENVLADAYPGETIVVDAAFNPLGGDGSGATLGSAGASSGAFVAGNPLGAGVYFPAALANHLSGSDIVAGSEITAQFNSDVDDPVVLGAIDWYYGTDGMPGSDVDFVSTALHEIGHGLGWAGTVLSADGSYLNDPLLIAYDSFVTRESDGALLSTLSNADRLTAATSDDISWGGAYGIAANGGTRPHLYAPNPWETGSSYSHLDEGDYPLELMGPQATPGTGHGLGGLTQAILQDQGWTFSSGAAAIAIPEPRTAMLLGIAAMCIRVFRRGNQSGVVDEPIHKRRRRRLRY